MMIADLHIHSKYSRATSRDLDPEHLDLWARRKGIGLIGTGDFTHPAWREELAQKLVPAEEGLYVLKEEYRLSDPVLPFQEAPRFVVTGEISSIYKHGGKTRKVHNVILLPGLDKAEELSHKLEAIGNIHSDGRPILGLSSHDLLEITLETCPDAVFIPAHIWTPHFSLFGAFSGYDAIEECFEDLTPHIRALETGLSSDPPMNWRVSALDRFTLVSNSDAHSPGKLGREANLLDIPLSYPALSRAIQTGEGFLGTIEFFPEEGKYHYDGHRNCGLCLKPSEAMAYGGKCPVCGKKLTIGVEHRVEELADRPEGFALPGAHPFQSLAPLPEVIAASTGLSAGGKKVAARYESMLKELGPEFFILREAPLEDVGQVAGPCVQEGLRRLRAGQVLRSPGYDGEYGAIQLLDKTEIEALGGQQSLFGVWAPAAKQKKPLPKPAAKLEETAQELSPALPETPAGPYSDLNDRQREAVTAQGRVVAVVAGPGTGKTKTLIARISYLIGEMGVSPQAITAVTFTNKAAGELKQRLEAGLGKKAVKGITVGTFHSICLELLQKANPGGVGLIGPYEARELAEQVIAEQGLKLSPRRLLQEISKIKNTGRTESDGLSTAAFDRYNQLLKEQNHLDFDDLLGQTLSLFETDPPSRRRFTHLLVDEFQDSNDVQYRLLQAWGAQGESLFVIGDPDQSIYGFRGSDAACFDRLAQDYPQMDNIRLTVNYRSTPQVVGASLPVISQNPGGKRELCAHRPDGELIRVVEASTPLSEGIYVAKQIGIMVGGVDMLEAGEALPRRESVKVRDFSEIAVLCRTHRQLDRIESCLQKESIPYVVAGREDDLDDPLVRGAICFFRHLLSPGDGLSLSISLKLLFGCPKDLARAAGEQCRPDSPSDPAFWDRLFSLYEGDGRLAQWRGLGREFLSKAPKEKPRKLLEALGAAMKLPDTPAWRKLLDAAVFYKDMPSLLTALDLGQEGDLMRAAGAKSYAAGAVTLMTLHGSKGLEFPAVFLCGVNQGSIPLESAAHPGDPQEERRLFYVGMTRAKEELFLITSKQPSPFLQDIPASLCQWETALSGAPKPQQLSLFS